jgi:HlyD family secretion protein
LEGQVSRTANAQDKETRLMRVEIDLPNDKKLLHQGMYGRVTIQLGALPGALRIPSSALVGDVVDGNAKVYACKDGVAHLVPVRVGRDDGLQIDVLKGLSTEDQIVAHPSGALFDGAKVTILDSAPSTPKAPGK